MSGDNFIDIDFCNQPKHGQRVAGDVFLSRKIKQDRRIISVLSDGLGSGIKASVLANLTATMALRYTGEFVDIRKSAQTIMDTLPICEQRKISYSTFTILDIEEDGHARIIEHGNPPLLFLRGSTPLRLDRTELTLERWKDRVLQYSEIHAQLGDRIIFFSDGVSQSGMGQRQFPLGWGAEDVTRFLVREIQFQPEIPAQELSRRLLAQALENDSGCARDDISCCVVHYRLPQRLLVVTGPPFSQERDPELAESVRTFPGRKAICGGTTATIISRHLGRPVTMSLADLDPDIPPAAAMEGVDIVTEGTLTLAKIADFLESSIPPENGKRNPARELASLMLESDIVEFVVGTRINEAHQDPTVPVELDLRRNIVRRIAATLESRHLKETTVRFV